MQLPTWTRYPYIESTMKGLRVPARIAQADKAAERKGQTMTERQVTKLSSKEALTAVCGRGLQAAIDFLFSSAVFELTVDSQNFVF